MQKKITSKKKTDTSENIFDRWDFFASKIHTFNMEGKERMGTSVGFGCTLLMIVFGCAFAGSTSLALLCSKSNRVGCQLTFMCVLQYLEGKGMQCHMHVQQWRFLGIATLGYRMFCKHAEKQALYNTICGVLQVRWVL